MLPVPNAKQRRILAKSGVAMPDGSFYVRDAQELDDAIHAVGRAQPTNDESEVARRNAVRRHIIDRAKALNLSSKIPDTWNSDGSLKHSEAEEFMAYFGRTKMSELQVDQNVIAHFGRKGMKWGEHVFGGRGGSSSHPVHVDVTRARIAQETIKKHGLSALGNNDLRALNQRNQLESDYARLTGGHKSEGQKFIEQFAKEQGKQAILKYGPKGAEWLVKQGFKTYAGKHAA